MQLMRAGRARWKIENETFNTLKTQGYHYSGPQNPDNSLSYALS